MHLVAVPLLLALAAGLALSAARQDSITYDETSHLTAGMSYLVTGDFRLAPDHPPLAKMWAALPLWLRGTQWPPGSTAGWAEGDVWKFGRAWLFDYNDCERLVGTARCMMVVLLLATCLCIYAAGRRIFGPGAGLLALILAVLSSTMLAHGHYVTTDIPVALCFLLVLITFARLLQRLSWGRLLAAAAALSAAALTKFSWPLVLPALALMAVMAVLRREPLNVLLMPVYSLRKQRLIFSPVSLASRGQKAAVLCGAMLMMGAFMWLAVWTCFGWRFEAVTGAGDWRRIIGGVVAGDALLQDERGQMLPGLVPKCLQYAREHRLLPDAYIAGFAYTFKSTLERDAYLMGEVREEGWRTYFPVAFGIKTELAVFVLLAGGVLALALRRGPRVREPLFFGGLAALTVVYAWSALTSHINIGHRHLLPIYPAVFIVAGAAVAWGRSRIGQVFVAAAVVWLAVTNARTYPQYLCYFNEIVGGPANGHRYLADSNIDWGQDLKRLAKWAKSHPDETIKLAYFGTANPAHYGFRCEMLPSSYPFATPAALTAGTYVVSATQLLGVYEEAARDDFWADATNVERYQQLYERFGRLASDVQPASRASTPTTEREEYERLSGGRLMKALRERKPDERVGYSLFVYRLTDEEVEANKEPK